MGRAGRVGLVLWILCVCGGNPATAAEDCTLYVVRRGWHVDIGFDTAGLGPPMSSMNAAFPGVQHLIFGFGDAHYLRSQHHGPGTLLAALWPGDAVILTTVLAASPEVAFGATHVIRLKVSAAQYDAAQRFVWHALTVDQAADIEAGHAAAPGPYEGSLYLRAARRYSAVHTCNTWVAEALQAAGLPVRSRGVVFAGTLWNQVRRLAHPEPASGHLPPRGDHTH
jgi:hypothetical protein